MAMSTERACARISMRCSPSHKRIISGILRDGVVVSAMPCVAVDADGEAPAGWCSDS